MGVKLSAEREALIKRYETELCFIGTLDFIKLWRALREKLYLERKERGEYDPLDIFDDLKGPIWTSNTKQD